MSKTTTEPKPAAAPARAEIGPTMMGSEILVAALEREGVDTIFAYPGGASMELHQALTRSKKIRTVLPRHEQGGAFAAEGYARASGRAGVCALARQVRPKSLERRKPTNGPIVSQPTPPQRSPLNSFRQYVP